MVNFNKANKTELKSDVAYKGGHIDQELVGDVGHSVHKPGGIFMPKGGRTGPHRVRV